MSETLYEVKKLKKYFPIKMGLLQREIGQVKAVDDVSFSIRRGETMGLVGESGCGKTTLGRCLMLLVPPTSGELIYKNNDISKSKGQDLKRMRREMAMIFQDPYSSLNPRMTIGEIVGEPLEIHGIAKGRKKDEKVRELLETVGLSSYHIYRYPHEFSGGQKQRIGIARALAINPQLIVADEPVAALDVSVRAMILNLLQDLQKQLNLTYFFISHDLSIVKHICDRVMIMYLGEIVEYADTEELYANPVHPYTKALISAIPIPDPTVKRERIILSGDVPTPINLPKGCRFQSRCPYSKEECINENPELVEISKGHFVACNSEM
jgi:oligopeptide transport system ATP-binding protein